MLDKIFSPQDVEARLYKAWEEGGCFRPGVKSGKPYTIALPPPNVTGSLHMGHAPNHTLDRKRTSLNASHSFVHRQLSSPCNKEYNRTYRQNNRTNESSNLIYQ